ncbi:MAG: DUF1730 domain-containing protein [Candidatus Gracilibacteria bacterium]|nr:DUF1730 domain-containing protein [Candidatus Gracilibacteria bacterium]
MIKEKIELHAKSLGFDLIGFTDVEVEKEPLEFYKNWLKKKYQGKMEYMEKLPARKDLSKILANAKTVISLGMNYYYEQKPLKSGFGRVARYAYGRDYHKIMGKKLKALEAFIKTLSPTAKTKSFVDTGPILERSFAEKAGLGVIGKNSCLITKEFGSWVFLAEVITDLELVEKQTERVFLKKPCRNFEHHACEKFARAYKLDRANFATVLEKTLAQADQFPLCGTCTRCMDACPTKAIIAPGVIDARKCISYLTIENKKQIPKKFHDIIRKTRKLYGCDICQEVCPHNRRASVIPATSVIPAKGGIFSKSLPGQASKVLTGEKSPAGNIEPLLSRKIAGDSLNLKKILAIKSDAEFLSLFAGSPLMRAKRKGLQRNAKILR